MSLPFGTLNNLIFSNPEGDDHTLETGELLLVEGLADASGQYDDPGYSPSCAAIRLMQSPQCRLLIVEGLADTTCAFDVDPHTGRPFLTRT